MVVWLMSTKWDRMGLSGIWCQHWEVLKSIHQTSLFSIAMGKGQIIMGLPEDSEGQNLGGSIQTFVNAGWQQERGSSHQ